MIWGEIWRLISSGSLSGIPTWALMGSSLAIGVIIGWLIKKLLKLAIILIVAAMTASYLGFFTFTLEKLRKTVETYGPQVVYYATLIIGVLPISLGFFLGLFIGLFLA